MSAGSPGSERPLERLDGMTPDSWVQAEDAASEPLSGPGLRRFAWWTLPDHGILP